MIYSNQILLLFNLVPSHLVPFCPVYFLSNGNLTHPCFEYGPSGQCYKALFNNLVSTCLSPSSPFSLTYLLRVRLHLSGVSLRKAPALPYQQTQGVKACQGQTVQPVRCIRKQQKKKFYAIGPRVSAGCATSKTRHCLIQPNLLSR